jgi:hypothetical protein
LILKTSDLSEYVKVLFTIPGALLFLLLVSSEIRGDIGQLELDFKDRTCSMIIEKAPLKTVLTKIKEEKGIWFKVTQLSAEEMISIRFSDLSIREGMERILRGFNYSLHYDQDGKLLGVTILGMKEGSDYRRKKLRSKSRIEGRRGIHPKTLSGLEFSSQELPYDSPAVSIVED